MENLYLIAGLGNPGAEYARTRHNVGFMVAERLARRWHGDWKTDSRFRSSLASVESGGRRVLLCRPQTWMNSSGEAIRRLKEFYRVALTRLLVVVDDADLPLGELRMRPRGSSGGHHGLESVEQHLGTREYPRLRIGIGRAANDTREITGHVLGRFSGAEIALWERVLGRAADQAACWLDRGITKAMNQFNGAVQDSGDKNIQTE